MWCGERRVCCLMALPTVNITRLPQHHNTKRALRQARSTCILARRYLKVHRKKLCRTLLTMTSHTSPHQSFTENYSAIKHPVIDRATVCLRTKESHPHDLQLSHKLPSVKPCSLRAHKTERPSIMIHRWMVDQNDAVTRYFIALLGAHDA
jgi:hypothetical protein